MAKIKFARASAPVGSVEFSRNPSAADYERTISYAQPRDRSDGGDWYIYDKALSPQSFRTLHWKNIPVADYTAFMTFLGVVVGAKNNFTFTDYDGTTYTARIWNADELRSKPVFTNRESLTVVLKLE